MKYIKQFENINWDKWDEEEYEYEQIFTLIRIGGGYYLIQKCLTVHQNHQKNILFNDLVYTGWFNYLSKSEIENIENEKIFIFLKNKQHYCKIFSDYIFDEINDCYLIPYNILKQYFKIIFTPLAKIPL